MGGLVSFILLGLLYFSDDNNSHQIFSSDAISVAARFKVASMGAVDSECFKSR